MVRPVTTFETTSAAAAGQASSRQAGRQAAHKIKTRHHALQVSNVSSHLCLHCSSIDASQNLTTLILRMKILQMASELQKHQIYIPQKFVTFASLELSHAYISISLYHKVVASYTIFKRMLTFIIILRIRGTHL